MLRTIVNYCKLIINHDIFSSAAEFVIEILIIPNYLVNYRFISPFVVRIMQVTREKKR